MYRTAYAEASRQSPVFRKALGQRDLSIKSIWSLQVGIAKLPRTANACGRYGSTAGKGVRIRGVRDDRVELARGAVATNQLLIIELREIGIGHSRAEAVIQKRPFV